MAGGIPKHVLCVLGTFIVEAIQLNERVIQLYGWRGILHASKLLTHIVTLKKVRVGILTP